MQCTISDSDTPVNIIDALQQKIHKSFIAALPQSKLPAQGGQLGRMSATRHRGGGEEGTRLLKKPFTQL